MKSSSTTRWVSTWAGAARFMGAHRRSLVGGGIAALIVVGTRIALPWSLKAAVKSFTASAASSTASSQAWMPNMADPLVLQAIGFLVLLLAMGYADYRERLCFARFAIGFVHDLRSTAADVLRRRIEIDALTGIRHGDAIARLIGDTARIKTGFKGCLVHVATNGAMAIGVTVVLMMIDPMLGLAFGLGGFLIALVTWQGATAIYRRAAKYRAKEGVLAETIHSAQPEAGSVDSFSAHSSESAAHEARITLLQGRTTWAAHVLFGATVVGCLWLGIRGVHSGRIDAGNMVIFVLYALMMRAPLVQLARQGVRVGKIVASLERVLEIVHLDGGDSPASTDVLEPLTSEIRINELRVRLGKGAVRRTCLRIDSLTIGAGEHIAIIGPQGSGKTTLLRVLAGALPASHGEVSWNGRMLNTQAGCPLLRQQTRLLSALPTWRRRSLRDVLAVPENMSDEAVVEIIIACGAKQLIRRWTNGIHTKLSSKNLSLGERRQIALASALMTTTLDPSVLLIDDLTSGMSKHSARKMMSATFAYAGTRTVLMCFSRPTKVHKFDRVIELHNGRVAIDAIPEVWAPQSRLDPRSLSIASPDEPENSMARDWKEGNQLAS